MPVKINIRHVEKAEVKLRGELPAAELDLSGPDELVHARTPLHYDLTAQSLGQDILVRGQLEFELNCECARCLKPFVLPVKLTDWAVHLPLEGSEKVEVKDDNVDLTPFLREDILLEFPQHPLCEADCAGLPNRTAKPAKKKKGGSQASDASVWSELNKLKF
jgi:uncharacterized metal-binding protein YceD (DUF177 family)